jgi:malonyl-CoA O-methyltransferase
MIAKAVIKHNFSRYARHYDRYARIQQRTGDALLTHITGQSFGRILDMGCGTGQLTYALQRQFPRAVIHALDICPDMLAVARDKPFAHTIEFMAADVECAELNGPYDLIVSNATFQWLSDMQAMMTRCRSCLGSDGRLLFSLFGPDTYRELAEVVAEVWQATITAASAFRLDENSTAALLGQHFNEVSVDRQCIQTSYPDLLTLLRTIKYTGTQGEGLSGRTLLRRDIHALETVYRQRYGAITATHEIITAQARKAKTA